MAKATEGRQGLEELPDSRQKLVRGTCVSLTPAGRHGLLVDKHAHGACLAALGHHGGNVGAEGHYSGRAELSCVALLVRQVRGEAEAGVVEEIEDAKHAQEGLAVPHVEARFLRSLVVRWRERHFDVVVQLLQPVAGDLRLQLAQVALVVLLQVAQVVEGLQRRKRTQRGLAQERFTPSEGREEGSEKLTKKEMRQKEAFKLGAVEVYERLTDRCDCGG
eukprot:scaffold298_cov247-Pinguiococcus_pyrenoidosus.AAC.32